MQTLSKSLKFLLYYVSSLYLEKKDNLIELQAYSLAYQIKYHTLKLFSSLFLF